MINETTKLILSIWAFLTKAFIVYRALNESKILIKNKDLPNKLIND